MKDNVEVFWFSEQPYGPVTDEQLEKFDSGRLGFPNSYFDPGKAHELYTQYHDQYALADEVGFDGIMTNEHHASYWCMKPSVNLDAAVISKITKNVKIAILGNVIAINDPVRMAEEIAMLDCYSGGAMEIGRESRHPLPHHASLPQGLPHRGRPEDSGPGGGRPGPGPGRDLR